jgi:DNA processing protein
MSRLPLRHEQAESVDTSADSSVDTSVGTSVDISVDMEERRIAHMALSHLGMSQRLARAVGMHGAVTVVRDLRRGVGDARDVERASARWSDFSPSALERRMASLGVTYLIPGDLGWPSTLDDLAVDQRPFGLWVRGSAEARLALLRSVAIVGSRASTPYGERVALAMAGDLASAGWTVVSGGAYGIDAAAHRGAIAVDGMTVAVLACGVDVAYPRAHDALFATILDHGLLISEVPPGEPPARFRFLERNRLIAALTRGTVVVEASMRSGALSTAARAESLGRIVMGVPGPVTSIASSGVHEALRSGALLVTCAQDVSDLLGPMEATRGGIDQRPDIRDGLDPDARTVLDALPARGGRTIADVHGRTGLGVLKVSSLLGRLEATGLVTCHEGRWRVSDVGRSATAR